MCRKNAKKQLWIILSGLIPMLFFGVALGIEGIFPVGDRQIFVCDAWHQYYPFVRLLHEKLQNGGSLLLSWESGFGSNFLVIMAYYAASPLNFLTALFPTSWLRTVVTVELLLKIGCAGSFFALFLRGTFHQNEKSLMFFSTLYATCSYIMGYCWCFIWLDTVALLPLVILGLVNLVREGKYRLYVISLAVALFANFYIGIFVCIFSVLAYFCILICCSSFKQVPKITLKFAGASLLGGGLAAVLLLPTYEAMQLTYSMNNNWPDHLEFYENWLDLLENLISWKEPSFKEGMPNFACGMLPLVCMGPFIVSKHIRIREKVLGILLLAFIFFSCNCNYLNYIWHGFHFPNMVPYRFAFLFSFVLLTIGYRAFILIEKEKFYSWYCIPMVLIAAGFFVIGFIRKNQEMNAVYWSFFTAFFYVFVIVLYMRKLLNIRFFSVFMTLIVFVETAVNIFYGMEADGTSAYSSYLSNEVETDALLDWEKENATEGFYRTETTAWYTLNNSALYGYNGISQFSSTANQYVSRWTDAIGLSADAGSNRSVYAISTPFTNLLCGLDYVIERSGCITDSYAWTNVAKEGNSTLYESKFPVSLGFWVNSKALEYECNPNGIPFEELNEIFKDMTGIETPLFTVVSGSVNAVQTMEVSEISDYKYSFTKTTVDDTLVLDYPVSEDAQLYGYVISRDVDTVGIQTNHNGGFNTYQMAKAPFAFPIGSASEETEKSLTITPKSDTTTGTVTVYVYQMNTKIFEQGYEMLKKFSVTSYDDTHVNGTIDALVDGYCYFSIANDGGWKAYVDGEEVKTASIGDAMLAVPVTKGEHEIKLVYCPKGFVLGVGISVGSVLILLVLYGIERKKKRGKKSEKSEGDHVLSGDEVSRVSETTQCEYSPAGSGTGSGEITE